MQQSSSGDIEFGGEFAVTVLSSCSADTWHGANARTLFSARQQEERVRVKCVSIAARSWCRAPRLNSANVGLAYLSDVELTIHGGSINTRAGMTDGGC